MAAGYQELFVEQGTDYITTITLDDINGDPFNLVGYTAKSQIKKSYYSANTTAEFTVSFTDSENGIISISLSSANTANISAGRYLYDVVIKDDENNIKTRVLEGQIIVSPGVTGIINSSGNTALVSVKSYSLPSEKSGCKFFTADEMDKLVEALHNEAKVI